MTNPLLQKYAELHNPKQPEPPTPVYNHLRPEEHRLVQILEGMIQDIRNGKVFLDNYEEEKENYAMKLHLDYGLSGYHNPSDPYPGVKLAYDLYPDMHINKGRMINLRVFKKYD